LLHLGDELDAQAAKQGNSASKLAVGMRWAMGRLATRDIWVFQGSTQ